MLRNLTAEETKRILKIAKAIKAGYYFDQIKSGNYYLATDLNNNLLEFTDQQLEKIIDTGKNIFHCIATAIETEEKETIDKSRAEEINEALTAAILGQPENYKFNMSCTKYSALCIYWGLEDFIKYRKSSLTRYKEEIILYIETLRLEKNKEDKKLRKSLVSNIISQIQNLNKSLEYYNKELIEYKALIDNNFIELTDLLNNSADPVKLIDINNLLTAEEIALVNKEKKAKKETKKPEKNKFSDIDNFEKANNLVLQLSKEETETNSLKIIADQKLKIAIRSGKDQLTIEKLYKNFEKLNNKLEALKADIIYLSDLRFKLLKAR